MKQRCNKKTGREENGSNKGAIREKSYEIDHAKLVLCNYNVIDNMYACYKLLIIIYTNPARRYRRYHYESVAL